MRVIALLAAAFLMTAAARAATSRTFTRPGFCSFAAPAGWRLKEDWKSQEPGLDLSAPAARVSIAVRFYKDGDPRYPSLKAYLKHVEHPNRQVQKVVGPETKTALSGRPAVAVHLEMLELIWATMRVGQKQTILMDIVAGAYPGGFCSVMLSAPEPVYPAARAQFERFLAGFRLLKAGPSSER